jgi:hypothetical protein
MLRTASQPKNNTLNPFPDDRAELFYVMRVPEGFETSAESIFRIEVVDNSESEHTDEEQKKNPS